MQLQTVSLIYRAWNQSPLRIAGTEKTYEYHMIAATRRGRVGVRPVGSFLRIRIEPVVEEFATGPNMLEHMRGMLGDGWKQPEEDGQYRFSRMVHVGNDKERDDLVRLALQAIGVSEGLNTLVNIGAPDWARAIVQEMADAETVHETGIEPVESDVKPEADSVPEEPATVANGHHQETLDGTDDSDDLDDDEVD